MYFHSPLLFASAYYTTLVFVVPPAARQQQTEQHRWSGAAVCPEGQARGLSEVLQANLWDSYQLYAQAEGIWKWTHKDFRKIKVDCCRTFWKYQQFVEKWEVVFLLRTCKRQQHPGGPADDLAVQMLLALSNRASPENNKIHTIEFIQPLCFTDQQFSRIFNSIVI